MIIRSTEFLVSGIKPDHFPKSSFPEIAFAGRSNVGKSSLINSLLGRKTLVRTSRHPGQTRTINFFLVNKELLLVDLPGYGFSKASKEVIQSYQEATEKYLLQRRNLVMVVLLLDIRRLPSREDKAFCRLVRSSDRKLLVVLTKSDTLGRGSWKKAWSSIAGELSFSESPPIFFSARTGEGKEGIWGEITKNLEVEQLLITT